MNKIYATIYPLTDINEQVEHDEIYIESNFISNNIDLFGEIITLNLRNIENNNNIICLVSKFINNNYDDKIYVPNNIMKKLNLMRNSIVELSIVNIKKGKYIKLKPYKSDFYNIDDPKLRLENELKKHKILRKDQIIIINDEKTIYNFLIIELKDDNDINIDIANILNVDINVDFDIAMDYVEPIPIKKENNNMVYSVTNKNEKKINIINRKSKNNSYSNTKNSKFIPFSGKSYSLK